MSNDSGTSEQEWPRTCPACGTELTSAVLDFDTSNEKRAEFNPGEMAAIDYCPNPDCPLKTADSPADEA